MKKLASLALATGSLGAALIGGTAPSASAATTQTYLRTPAAFSTKAACVADENAFAAKIKAAGDVSYGSQKFTSSFEDQNSMSLNQCVASDQGWIHSDAYSGTAKIDNTDIELSAPPAGYGGSDSASKVANAYVGSSASAKAVQSAFAKYTVTKYFHAYDFATKADCLSHFNSVKSTIAANSNDMIVGETDNVSYQCYQYQPSPAPAVRYQYSIDYLQNHNVKAPFGYESTETSGLYIPQGTVTYGKTDSSGNWVKTGVL